MVSLSAILTRLMEPGVFKLPGTLLNHVSEVNDLETLYDELMNLILQFADSGVIHGDFNEFNIILTEDEKPVIIDFPQMMSTEHPNAQMYFERDVNCIREFFKKRYRCECFIVFTFFMEDFYLGLGMKVKPFPSSVMLKELMH